MDRARLQELIHAQLDGELSAGERAELARLVLQDADARRLHDALLGTDRLLRDIPAAEPPPGLREAILARSARPVRPGDSGKVRWQRQSSYRIAAVFLGGLLIIGVGYLVADGRGPATELQGSLGGARGAQKAALTLRAEGVTVIASLRREGEKLILDLDSSTAIACEIAVKIDPAATTFAGSAGSAQLTSAKDRVTVQLAAGSRRTALDFSGAAPIQLELRADGRLLGEGRLSVSDP